MSRVETKSVGLLACSNLVFHAFDFVVGALVTINAIVLLFQTRSLAGFILPLYFTVAGIIIVAFTMYAHPKLYAALIFYFSFIGRGLTFLFIGTVFLAFNDDFSTATGVITIIVAFVYLIFSIWTKFCKLYCPLPPPFTQRQDGIGGKTSSDNDQQADTSGNHGDNDAPPAVESTSPVQSEQTTTTSTTTAVTGSVNINITVTDNQQYGNA